MRFVPLEQHLSHYVKTKEPPQTVRTLKPETVFLILYSQCLLEHLIHIRRSLLGLFNGTIDKAILAAGYSCDSCPQTTHNPKVESLY